MPVVVKSILSEDTILNQQQSNLVESKQIIRPFGLSVDYVQLNLYNSRDTLLSSKNVSYTNDGGNVVEVNPERDLLDSGYQLGTFYSHYHFLRPVVSRNSNLSFFINKISSDRKEIKIKSTTLSRTDLQNNASNYINLIQNRTYFVEFYLDFGSNNLQTALSIALETTATDTSVIVKLKDSLPLSIAENFPLNIVEKVLESQVFELVSTSTPTPPPPPPTLRPANFSIDVDSSRIGSSNYYSYDEILNSTGSNSEFQTVLSFISSSNLQINVDYSEFNNFIHYSSANQRLTTFKDKLTQLESYQDELVLYPNSPSKVLTQNKIDNIIKSFDNFENYLYYNSSSTSWPKLNTEKPYSLYSVSSSTATNWYNYRSTSASFFDEQNNNNLIYGVPLYLQERDDFNYVKPFIQSMGQMFDDIWLYTKAMTDLWKNKNSLTDGISKDLVANALQSLGISLYTDGDQDDLYTYLYGINPSGSYSVDLQPNQTLISASKYTLSGQDEAKSVFKRIYNNLPALLKSKGTSKFVNYLATLYGVPETILSPLEFGGVDKNSDSVEYVYNRYSSAPYFNIGKQIDLQNTSGNAYGLNSLEFRFLPTSVSSSLTQTLVTNNTSNFTINLSSSYVGSYLYGDVILTNGTDTKIISLPIYVEDNNSNLDWWNVAWINEGTGSKLYVQNESYGKIAHNNSVVFPDPITDTATSIITFGSGSYYGAIQEVRGWSTVLDKATIDRHTLNPSSYVGNTLTSSGDLIFHYPLGNDLIVSVNNTTGSQPTQNSNYFINFSGFNTTDFVGFTENYYALPAVGGFSTPVTDKIRLAQDSLASTRLQRTKSVWYQPTSSRTLDTHIVQVGFSPQDNINKNIINELGDTYNLDNIIGDPSYAYTDSYPLGELQGKVFDKYVQSYNYKDYISLIETFHKSLFRYLLESVPARTNTATGVVVKPHLLERNKVKRHEPNVSTGSVYESSYHIATLEASNPGNYSGLQGNNEGWFTGDITGSYISASLLNSENNPFLLVTEKVTDFGEYYKQYGGWDVLINNVSSSLLSTKKYKREKSLNELFGKIYLQNITNFSGAPQVAYYKDENNIDRSVTVGATSTVYKIALSGSVSGSNLFAYPTLTAVNRPVSSSFEWNDALTYETSYVRSREEGVKTISPNFNLEMVSGSSIGQVTNVDHKIPFMLFYDWTGNTLAERSGSANFHIKYLIDESGSVYRPEYSSSYYWNTYQGFGADTPVQLILWDGTGNASTAKETTIYHPLKRFTSVLYSSTGSIGTDHLVSGSYSSLTFDSLPGTYVNPFDLRVTQSADQFINNGTQANIVFSDVILDKASSWYTDQYLVTESSTFRAIFTASVDISAVGTGPVTLSLLRGGSTVVYSKTFPDASAITTMLVTGSNILRAGETYRVRLQNNSGGNLNTDSTNSYFSISPFTGSFAVNKPYWVTNSPNRNSLTSSLDLANAYGGSFAQREYAGSGYNTPTAFALKKYDQIRFESDESLVFYVMSVTIVGNRVTIELDREIPTGVNTSDFSIRRLETDPGFVIINDQGSNSGFIIPKYATDPIKNNISDIISNLTRQNLI